MNKALWAKIWLCTRWPLAVLVVFYVFWYIFVLLPRERAAAKYLDDLTYQKCLADVAEQESKIPPNGLLAESEREAVARMKVSCNSDYQLHRDQSNSRI